MDNYDSTIKTWDLLAQKYEDTFMDLKMYNESYDLFCAHLNKKHASIFEIGCGPGNITKYLLSKNATYKILATDAAPSMIALAEKNNPTANFEVMDCRNIGELKTKFDAIVCGFCLPYLAKAEFSKLLKDCFILLETNGLIYLSTIEGKYEDSKFETSSDGLHRVLVHYYSEESINSTLHENSFSILEVIRIPYTKGDGSTSIHLVFIAKKSLYN